MNEQNYTRRASYGPSSPVVGSRGARTRQQILDAALEVFTERGFHDTAVEDIATRAETSRATLYQYFESKEAIFVELMNVSGAALIRVTRRLGSLGPTAAGFDNLHWWLGEWSWVFDRYAAMFIEWANVNSPKAPLRPRLARFVEGHTERFSRALQTADLGGADPKVISILVLSLVSRYHYIRHVYQPGLDDGQLLQSLAIAIQLLMFPETDRAVLDDGPQSVEHTDSERGPIPPVRSIGPLATLPKRDEPKPPSPLAGLSPQASRTVRQLLDAAGQVFADSGYDAANVDQIVTQARLARGTFYRYFSDKLELMTALANECAEAMCEPFQRLAKMAEQPDRAELRRWLREFLELHDRYAGVLRAWIEGFPIDPAVLAPCREIVSELGASVRQLFGPPRSYALDRRATGMMLAGLLEHFPNEGRGTQYEPSPDQIVEAQAIFVERVLLTR